MGWIHADDRSPDEQFAAGSEARQLADSLKPGPSPNSGELPGEQQQRLIRANALARFGGELLKGDFGGDDRRQEALNKLVMGRSGNAVPLRRCVHPHLSGWFDVIITETGAWIPALQDSLTDDGSGNFIPVEPWSAPESGGIGCWMHRRWCVLN